MRTTRAIVIAAAVATLLAACSSTPAAPPGTTPPSRSPLPTSTAPSRAVEVPDVIGMTAEEALSTLAEIGLEAEVEPEERDGLVTGVVPGVGQRAFIGASVTLMIETDAERATREQAEAEAAAAAEAERLAAEARRLDAEVCQPARDHKATWNAVSPDAFVITLVNDNETREELAAHCPDLLPDVDLARRAILNGNYIVGTDIPAGTYQTLVGRLEDCYWARLSGTGDIIDNDFISFSPGQVSVTVRAGEGFEVDGCGPWIAPSPLR
jgi:hypothetical protein